MSLLHSLNPRADVLHREQAFEANLTAARGLQDVLTTNLGPRGTLKMLVGGAGQIKTTKDGNVLLKEMQIQHPTAAVIARAATAQDLTVGDGSTTDILLIGEFMKLADHLLSEGIHPRKLVEGIELALAEALKFIPTFQVPQTNVCHDRELLLNIARSSLLTKLDSDLAENLSNVVVDSIKCLIGSNFDANAEAEQGNISIDLFMVEVLAMKSGVSTDTRFVKGMVMDHGCRHQDMPSRVENCYVLTCNVNLEYEKTEVNSSFFYSSVEQKARLAEAERRFTDSKVQKIIDLKRSVCAEGNKSFVVFNQKGIDPPALEMLAREGIMALRRVKRRNMERLTLCCGGQAVNAVEDLSPEDLGFAESCWEISMGDEKYTFVEGVKDPRSCCILVRAPTDHGLEQIKDAIRDGLRAVKNAIEAKALCPGAGAFELALSAHLHNYARVLTDKTQFGVKMVADGIICVPKALARNAGHDPQEVILKMEAEYRKSGGDVGVDLESGKTCVPSKVGIWDNVAVKQQSLILTTTLTTQLLLVDEVIRAGKQMSGN